jgi:hypothetical protein
MLSIARTGLPLLEAHRQVATRPFRRTQNLTKSLSRTLILMILLLLLLLIPRHLIIILTRMSMILLFVMIILAIMILRSWVPILMMIGQTVI